MFVCMYVGVVIVAVAAVVAIVVVDDVHCDDATINANTAYTHFLPSGCRSSSDGFHASHHHRQPG